MRRALSVTLAACLLLVLAACSGGAKLPLTPQPSSTPDLVAVRKDLTDEQLGSVALALADFGPRYGTFRPSPASGAQTLATRADLACDASRQINTLNKNGWIKAYARFYASPDPGQPETVAVGTNVDVFASKEGAAAKLGTDAATVSDDARSTSGCFGYAIEGVDRLAVSGVGDEMWGVRERINIHSLRGSISVVAFRRSNIVAMVEIVRLSAEDSTEELMALARELDKRIAPLLSSPLSMGAKRPEGAFHN
jgi:hypothetical protein